MKKTVTEYRVIYADIDAMGVVYYDNYLGWFERGRTEFFRELGIPYTDVVKHGIITLVSEVYCEYHRPARYDHVVEIETSVSSFKKVTIVFDYRIFRIAILKAFGFANRTIALHYLKFAGVIVGAGTVAGAVGGMLLGRRLVGMYESVLPLSRSPLPVGPHVRRAGARGGMCGAEAAERPAFSYEPAEFLGAKPWTDLAESQALAAFAFAEGVGAALRE